MLGRRVQIAYHQMGYGLDDVHGSLTSLTPADFAGSSSARASRSMRIAHAFGVQPRYGKKIATTRRKFNRVNRLAGYIFSSRGAFGGPASQPECADEPWNPPQGDQRSGPRWAGAPDVASGPCVGATLRLGERFGQPGTRAARVG